MTGGYAGAFLMHPHPQNKEKTYKKPNNHFKPPEGRKGYLVSGGCAGAGELFGFAPQSPSDSRRGRREGGVSQIPKRKFPQKKVPTKKLPLKDSHKSKQGEGGKSAAIPRTKIWHKCKKGRLWGG